MEKNSIFAWSEALCTQFFLIIPRGSPWWESQSSHPSAVIHFPWWQLLVHVAETWSLPSKGLKMGNLQTCCLITSASSPCSPSVQLESLTDIGIRYLMGWPWSSWSWVQDSLNRNMQSITLSGRPINDCTFSESAFIYTKTPFVFFCFLFT